MYIIAKWPKLVVTSEAYRELVKLDTKLWLEGKKPVFYHAVKHMPIIDEIDVMVYGLDVVKSPHDKPKKH